MRFETLDLNIESVFENVQNLQKEKRSQIQEQEKSRTRARIRAITKGGKKYKKTLKNNK